MTGRKNCWKGGIDMWKKWRRSAAWMLAVLLMSVAVLTGGCGGARASGEPGTVGGRGPAEESQEEENEEKPENLAAQESGEEPESLSVQESGEEPDKQGDRDGLSIEEDGSYTLKEEVALYLHLYGHLPDNFISKREAQELGWDNKKGNLDQVAPGKSIGGSHFGNYEGMLPEKKGRKYYECDLEYEGGYRGAKRLIYSNDGLIFYTEDHYKTFEQLY